MAPFRHGNHPEHHNGAIMTINEIKDRDAFTARWLAVLNSPDAGSPKQRRIIIAALAKAHDMQAK